MADTGQDNHGGQGLLGHTARSLLRGEPLAYSSGGRGILDIVEKHPELLFLMFTNGTLIDRRTVRRLADMGNLTPAISVEGLRQETDTRRGAGVFEAVVRAMDLLSGAGVPVGISGTITRSNAREILSDEFIEFFFFRMCAFYGFFFQYVASTVPVTIERPMYFNYGGCVGGHVGSAYGID